MINPTTAPVSLETEMEDPLRTPANSMPPAVLPLRQGARPQTSHALPHQQLTQHGPQQIIDALAVWCFQLPYVHEEPSGISVPGTRALILDVGIPASPDAFIVGREFAHIHPPPDNGSLHLQLSAEQAALVAQRGWGEPHYLVRRGQWPSGLMLVFSPRDQGELEVVKAIVRMSYDHAVDVRSAASSDEKPS